MLQVFKVTSHFHYDRLIMCPTMKIQWLILVYMALASTGTTHEVQQCRVRFEDNGVCACSTQDPFTPVKCGEDNHSIEIQPCYCMYYDQHLNMSVLGHCLFSCFELHDTHIEISSSAALTDNICTSYSEALHRVGRFCGQCNDSYGLAVYSYKYINCILCEDYGYKNWLKYFAVALLPLTVFYILAVLMSFNVTSSSFNGLLLVIQGLTSQPVMMIAEGSNALNPKTLGDYFQKTIETIICITNLDFFRWIYPPFCLHPKVTILEVLALDYIVALYPFLLIFMTYVLVTAYDKQYRVLVWMWKPFKLCTRRYRETWNIRTSLIQIFATFILLSSVKILGVSFQILSVTSTYSVNGQRLAGYYVLYDANTEYFSSGHLPFALLAMAISFIFVLLPLLLLAIYPCGCFHKCCLNRCGLTCQTLHVFMDAFQGSYRTEPQDMRYFSALYLLLRVPILAQIQLFTSPLWFYTAGILALVSAALVAIFQPYKITTHNTADSVLFTIMGIFMISIHEAETLLILGYHYQWNFVAAVQAVAIVTIVLYLISLLTWKLLHVPIRAAFVKIKALLHHVSNHADNSREPIEYFEREWESSELERTPLLGQQKRST